MFFTHIFDYLYLLYNKIFKPLIKKILIVWYLIVLVVFFLNQCKVWNLNILIVVSGCIAVKKILRARKIQGDTNCARCGASEKSINHVFFECPPVIQVWVLSRTPSNQDIFPTQSLYANMDHLFCRVPQLKDHHFAWILWYIWKRMYLPI